MRAVVLTLLALALVACNQHKFSPPARALPLESVAPVGEGRVGLALTGGVHGAIFGPSASNGSAGVRVSPHSDVDVLLEGHIIHIDGESAMHLDPNVYAARVGAKYRLLPALALTAGLGGGLHTAGTYVSPDVGVIGAWENGYVVPFFSLRGSVSAPLTAKAIDTTAAGHEPAPENVGTPQTTGGFAMALGLRVVIPPGFEPNEGIRGSLLAGPGLLYLHDGDDELLLLQLGAGGEVTF